jgi:opacity protein-like surface antigen
MLRIQTSVSKERRAHRVMILLLAVLGASIAAPCLAWGPYTRAGWVVGVAYGPGQAKITGADSLETGWLSGPAQTIRVGRMFGPRMKIGYEHQAWLREQGFQSLKIRAGTQLEALAVTAYLGRPSSAWGGLFVTAGGGYAHCRLTFLEPLAPGESPIGDTFEVVFLQDEFGWGGFAGAGYEFQISRSFAAGVMFSYNHLGIGGSIYDTADFIPLTANLNWSF